MYTSTTQRWIWCLLLALAACRGTEDAGILRAAGTIEVTEVRVAARTPGEVRLRGVEEGAAVRAGDTLAVIDHELLTLQLRQAEAATAAAEAQLDLLRSGARPEDIEQAEARLVQVEVERSQARADAERFRALAAAGSATPKQLDDVEARLRVAEAQHEAARQAVNKLRHLARPEELRAAAAQVAQARAAADLIRRQVADAYVVAPIDGTVLVQAVESGELVAPGTPVVTLADLQRAYLRIYVPEPALGRIRLQQPVEVYTDAYPDRPMQGRVTFIAPEAEFTPKNVQTREERVKLVYEVEVEVPNPEGILKPGMYADAVLPLDQAGAEQP